MAESYSVEAILRANVGDFVSKIKQAESQMQGFVDKNKSTLDSFKQVGTAATAGGAAIAAGLGGAIKVAADFQEGMSKVQAISGATGDDMVLLSAKAREMGSKTKFSATQASEAFSYMAMAGWKTTDMLDGIAPVMNLAAASGEDLALTADILTDGLTAFGLKAKDGGRFADVMAAASSNANTNVAMLGESFKYVAPLAGAMGYSVEDTSLALGLMANAGVKGSQAGTSLKTMFTNLAKPTKSMKGAMDDLGISLTNSDGSMKSMEEVISDLRTGFGGLDEAQQANYAATIFGKEAMAGALAVINASEEDYNKLKGAIDNSKGAAENMAKVMQDNLNGSLTNLKSALEEVAISIGSALIPYIEKAVAFVQMLADKFNGLDDKTKVIIAVIAALSAGFLLLVGPILMLIGFIPSILAGWAALTTVLGTVATALTFLTGPVAIAIAAIIAIGAALVLAYNKVAWFRDGVNEVWGKLSSLATQAFNAVKEAISTALTAVVEFAKSKMDELLAFWNENGAMISQAAQNVWNVISTVIGAAMTVISGVIQVAWFLIQALVKAVWENIKGVISGALNIIMGIVQAFSGLFTGNFSAMWEGIVQVFKGAVELIWNAVQLMLWGRMLKGIAVFAGAFRGSITSMWGTIKAIFQMSVEFVKSIFTKGFQAMQSAGSSIMNAIRSVISAVWNGIKSVFSSSINVVQSVFKAGFNAIKTVATTIMNAIKTVISTVWNVIKTVFSGSMSAIKSLVTSGFNLIRSTINTIMNAVRTVISTVWNAIKTVITSAVNAIKSAVTAGFNAIRSIVTSVMNAIRSVVTSVWNGIRSVINSVMSAIRSVIQAGWNGVKSTITSAVNSIKSAVTSGFNAVVNAIRSAMTRAVSTVKSMMSSMVSAVTGAAGKFLQAGKDLVSGLISGIMSMAGAAVEAITGVVGGVVSAAKNALGIKSPSRVFMAIGNDTMQGWIDGMSKRKEDTSKIMKDTALLLLDVADHYRSEDKKIARAANAEIVALEKRAKEDIDKIHRAAAKKKRKLTKDENIKIQRIQENTAKKKTEIERKAVAESVSLQSKEQAAKLKELKLFVEDKASLGELSLQEEIAVWERALKFFEVGTKERVEVQKNYNSAVDKLDKEKMAKFKDHLDEKKTLENLSQRQEVDLWAKAVDHFKEGTEEKIEAQKNYAKALNELNKQIADTNKMYSDQIIKVNEDLAKSEKDLTDAYTKSFDDREKSLIGFAGLFDVFKTQTETTGFELLTNLKGQVDGFKDWQESITKLSERAIDEGLLEELRQMGPKAAGEIAALNRLTDEQLTEYSELYREKQALARQQTEKELQGMKVDTANQIDGLRQVASSKLDTIRSEWNQKIKEITRSTDDELSKLEGIGKDAGQGLLKGLQSKRAAIVAEAQAIADGINEALSSVRDVGLNADVSGLRVPTVGGVNTAQYSDNKTDSKVSKPSSGGITQNITINSPKHTSPSENARIIKQQSRQLAAEWGL